MEYDTRNVKLLCVGCHLYFFHKSPVEAWQWLEKEFPTDWIAYLKKRAASVDKTRYDYKEIKAKIEKEMEELKKGVDNRLH